MQFNAIMRNLFLFALLLLNIQLVLAQDSVKNGQPKPRSIDTGRTTPVRHEAGNTNRGERKRIDYFRDTVRHERRKFDSALFTNVNVPTTSDYAEHLGKVYQDLTDIPGTLSTFGTLEEIHRNLDNEDYVLEVVKDRMSLGERTFNVRNLQMFNTLLDALDRNTDRYSEYLEQYDSTLDEIREQIADFRRDTMMRHIFTDTALKNTLRPQLQQLRTKWREVDSLVTAFGQEINTLKSHASAHSITIGELLNQVDRELKTVGTHAFQKEQPYLWESPASGVKIPGDFRDSYEGERQLARFYFSNTNNNRFWLPVIGILFFVWISINYLRLRKLKRMDALDFLDIRFINSRPIVPSVIFMLSLAPLFDIHAPAIYIEFIQFLLMVFLTFILRNHISSKLLFGWYIFILLFLTFSYSRIFGFSLSLQRWIMLLVDICSLFLGIYFLSQQEVKSNRWVIFAVSLFIFLNFLGIICNLTSRVTLSQIFSNTAFFTLSQTISLAIFVRLIIESFLVQVQTSRIRKNYPQQFDSTFISTSIRRFAMIIAVILWSIVFTINLNLFDSINDMLTVLFSKTRRVGNFSFTLGGILLFLGIIWFANFLQKYIAYFFGDTGDDAAIDDRGQRSRLMVTRLILLIGGFLLAVAASGLSVDRITVILGALGVGIGLGLQNIVNNFVSGVILIFDRPLRIGDVVDVGDKRGRVKGIGIRSSTLLTEDGAEVIIPNGDVLSQKIVNWTLSNNHARVVMSFPINKSVSPDKIDLPSISKIISDNHNVLQTRIPEIVVSPVNAKTMELKVFFWVNDFNKETITSEEVRTSIYEQLEKAGLIAE
ncbi:MAG: mechanosensitive ion channel protein [Bacteroidetes bacterium]|nr:MAG: mechanosensitive ion channel protein [Bacteroidota bacterium]